MKPALMMVDWLVSFHTNKLIKLKYTYYDGGRNADSPQMFCMKTVVTDVSNRSHVLRTMFYKSMVSHTLGIPAFVDT